MAPRSTTLGLLLAALLSACPKPIEPTEEVVAPASSDGEPAPPTEAPSSCRHDDECPRGEICDGEACLLAPREASERDACGVPPIEFARDSARLSPDNQARLAAASECLRAASLVLAGCRSASEPAELAARRAASVQGMLLNLGAATEQLQVATCEQPAARSVMLGLR